MPMARLCVQSPAASDLQLLELACGLEPRTRPGHAFSTSRITLMAEEYGEAKLLSK
jgi:hypothetical protein